MINLTGLTRFKILQEVENKKLYREFKVDYKGFHLDLIETNGDQNTENLMSKQRFFLKKWITLN